MQFCSDADVRMVEMMKLSDLRIVELHYAEPFLFGLPYAQHFVHKDEVERIIKGTELLHVDPGINPHNYGKTGRVVRIVVKEFIPGGRYWWAGPSLNNDNTAAHVMMDRIVWDKEYPVEKKEEEPQPDVVLTSATDIW